MNVDSNSKNQNHRPFHIDHTWAQRSSGVERGPNKCNRKNTIGKYALPLIDPTPPGDPDLPPRPGGPTLHKNIFDAIAILVLIISDRFFEKFSVNSAEIYKERCNCRLRK